MGERKDYSRSIRMTESIRKYVEQQNGDGFNQKFENMVLLCMEKQPQLEAEIKKRERDLEYLNRQIAEKRGMLFMLEGIQTSLERVFKQTKQV